MKMPDPIWLSYEGAITGSVGAVTGVAGFVLGYVGYRRSQQLKALDLRLELRRAEADVRTSVLGLPDLLRRALDSRVAVSAARGVSGSGWLEAWRKTWEQDSAGARALAGKLPSEGNAYGKTKHADLESKLVGIHVLTSEANALRAKYERELEVDDRERGQLRADQRARTPGTRHQP
jgi:hypothetical protein